MRARTERTHYLCIKHTPFSIPLTMAARMVQISLAHDSANANVNARAPAEMALLPPSSLPAEGDEITLRFSNSCHSRSTLHVLRRVGEGGAVLGGGVLRPVRRHVAQDHHDGAVGVHSLGRAEVVNALVGDDVGEVVL